MMPAVVKKAPRDAKVVEPKRWKEKKIVMDICRRDPKTKEIVCVKKGFEMVIRVAEPE